MTKVIVGGGSSVSLRGTIKPSMVYPGAGIALSTGSAWGTSITDNSSNWNTAYGWGDHASAGYLTSLTDGNGTTVNGTDGVDWGGTLTTDVFIDGNYGFNLGNTTPLVSTSISVDNRIEFNVNNANGSGYLVFIAGNPGDAGFHMEIGDSDYQHIFDVNNTGALLEQIDNISGNVSTLYLDNTYSLLSFNSKRLKFETSGTTLDLGSDATGDTYYRNSSGYFTRLPVGTNGDVLTLASGLPSWAAPSGGGGAWSLASGGTATGTNTFAMGSNPFILTSGVTTGTGATAGIQNVFNSLTTGNGLDISTSSLTTGKGLALTSTSTAINHTIGTNALFSSRISGTNANSSRTAVAGEFIATNTGTTSSNIAIYAAASGGTTNYSFYASGQMYVEGLATSSYVAYFKAGGLNQGIYISSNGGGILPIQTSFTNLGNSSQRFNNAFFSGNVSTGGVTTVLAALHSRGAGTTTGYNLLTENSGAAARFGVRDNGAIEFSGSAGTSGYLLQSNGASSPPTWVVAPSGGSGITRSINSVSGTTSAGAAASTDYVYNCTSTFTLTLPTAVGNTNRYTIKNSGTGTITVNTTSSQTIDGSLTAVMSTQYSSIDVISNGTNWLLI